jgi:hypothetical protein
MVSASYSHPDTLSFLLLNGKYPYAFGSGVLLWREGWLLDRFTRKLCI